MNLKNTNENGVACRPFQEINHQTIGATISLSLQNHHCRAAPSAIRSIQKHFNVLFVPVDTQGQPAYAIIYALLTAAKGPTFAWFAARALHANMIATDTRPCILGRRSLFVQALSRQALLGVAADALLALMAWCGTFA
jgi:hypothetical protein